MFTANCLPHTSSDIYKLNTLERSYDPRLQHVHVQRVLQPVQHHSYLIAG